MMRLKKIPWLRWSVVLMVLSLSGCTITIAPPAAQPTPTVVPAPVEGQAWWNEAVFYEIFVRSFADSNGDGIGDLNGLTQKLDYLNDGDAKTNNDLGINALWLMPLHPSPSYHGYDVTDFYAINPDYGTLADFKRLVTEAHKRGIHVVIDFVANHTSSQHPWFQQAQDPQSPYRNWYIWSETNPRTVGPWGQAVWHPGANGYFYGVFWEGMPDLNYKNPAVIGEMQKVVRFWLTETGIDGFRVDGGRYLVEDGDVLADSKGNHAWFKQMRPVYKELNPNSMTVGEIWTGNDAVAPYLQGDELDLAFNFDLAGAIVNSVDNENADAVRVGFANTLRVLPPAHMATFLTNHDMNRVMSELGDDVNKAKRAATILLTLPGTPFLYYGEELGMVGRKPDEDLRRPMQWSAEANAGFTTGQPWRAPASDYATKNVATQTGDPNSLLSHYRYLTALRQSHAALRIGDGFQVNSNNAALFAYLRSTPQQVILLVTNLRDEFQGDYQLSMEKGPLTPGVTYAIAPIWGSGDFAEITATDQGGFAPLQLNGGLGAGETLILQLNAAQ